MPTTQGNAYTSFKDELMREEGEKALRKLLKQQAEYALMQPGGEDQVAGVIEGLGGGSEQPDSQGQPTQQPAQGQKPPASPNEILQWISNQVSTGNLNKENVMQAVNVLAEAQVNVPGSRQGLIELFKGGKPGQPHTAPLGTVEANKIVKGLLETAKLVGEEGRAEEIHSKKFPVDMGKLNQDIIKGDIDNAAARIALAKETGNIPLLEALKEEASNTIRQQIAESPNREQMSSMPPVAPVLGEEAKSLGRTIPDVGDMAGIGAVGPGTGISAEGFYERDPITGDKTPKAELRQLQIREFETQRTKALVTHQVNLADKSTNFARTVTVLERSIANWKGAVQEGAAGGIIEGSMGSLKILAKRPGVARAIAFDMQTTVDASLALNNILTGQNRTIKGVVEMIQKTFPTRFMPSDMVAQLFSQSLENAYGIYKAFEKSGLTPEKLNSMSQWELDALDVEAMMATITLSAEEVAERDYIVENVLNTPPATKRDIDTRELSGKRLVSKDLEFKTKEIEELERKIREREEKINQLTKSGE